MQINHEETKSAKREQKNPRVLRFFVVDFSNGGTEVIRRSVNSFEITGDIAEGSPKRVILDEAEAWEADLIVVGSHWRRGLDRFALGSASQAVPMHAHCSVEIARSPREPR